MAGTTWFLAWRQPQLWSVCRCDGHNVESIDVETFGSATQTAAALATTLRDNGYAAQPAILGLPSHEVLVARVPIEPRQDHQAKRFALEEQLPLAAEEFVADFVLSPEKDHALGIVTATTNVKPVLDALEQQQVVVSRLCPTSLLVWQSLGERMPSRGPVACLIPSNENQIECLFAQDGQLTDWSIVDATAASVLRELKVRGDMESMPWAAFGVDHELISAIQSESEPFFVSDEGVLEASAQQADEISVGRQSPLVDLRRDELAPADALRNIRGTLHLVAVAAIVFLSCLLCGLHWRANQYASAASRYEDAERAAFKSALPGQKIPASIVSRLRSERKKLAAVAGQSNDLPQLRSEVATLIDVLELLPEEVPCRWERIRLESPGQLLLEGTVESFGDTGPIVDALEKGYFVVESPQTDQLPSRMISVRIRGERSDDASE